MSRARSLCVLAAVAASLGGCTFRVDKTALSADGSGTLTEFSTVSYQTVSDFVFRKSCTTCHGSSGGVNLESPASAAGALKDSIKQARAGLMPKPPNPHLTACQIKLLELWDAAKAPEVSSQPIGRVAECGFAPGAPTAPAPPEAAPEPTFAWYVSAVYSLKCNGCHGSGGEAEFTPINTVRDLLAAGLIRPGDGAGSLLYQVVSQPGPDQMPPESSKIPRLNELEANAIKDWIDQGATP